MENINPDSVINFLKTAGLDLLRGILVLVVGFFLVHWISKLLSRSKKLSVIEPTLRGFLHNLVKILLSVIVILTAVNIMGIPMTSVVTLLASGGVAIGLALQGAVGNLIGGLLLLILRGKAALLFPPCDGTEGFQALKKQLSHLQIRVSDLFLGGLPLRHAVGSDFLSILPVHMCFPFHAE